MKEPLVLGIDIGGSHITAALVNLQTREIVPASYRRRSVNAQDEADGILNSWCEVINDVYGHLILPPKKVGIAIPGPFDYVNGICLIKEQDKFRSLYKIDVKAELAKRLEIPPSNIEFINDAAGFLQGEVFAGAAKAGRNILGITLGTGLGSALYLNGQAKDAALWNSAFLNSIAEDYLSTGWFVKRYAELSGVKVNGVKDLTAGADISLPAIQVFREFGYNFAHFIVPIIRQYQLDQVIIGGNISLAFPSFSAAMEEILSAENNQAAIFISELKENAALIGAASCLHSVVPSHYQNKDL